MNDIVSPETSTCIIKIHRLRANFADLALSYTVEIDKKDCGQIRPRQTRSFEVSPGTHRLRIRFVPQRGSPQVEVVLASGETKEFQCRTGFLGSVVIHPVETSDT
jgi:hypothetical protein